MLTPQTPAAIATAWHQRRRAIEALPQPENLAALVEAAAQRYGQAPAWHFFEDGEVLSFQDVAALARQAAHAFAQSGITRGSTVALMLPNSALMLGSWLGLAYLGATCVAVNSRYTLREIAHVLKVSRAERLIVGERYDELAAALPAAGGVTLQPAFAGHPNHWAAQVQAADPSFTPAPAAQAEDIANVQFTSGTTGFPKGCELSQRYWINAAVVWAAYAEAPISRFLCNQHLFYLDGLFNTVVNLHRGTTTYYCVTPSVAKLDGWLQQYGIESMFYFDPLFAAEPQAPAEAYRLQLLHTNGFNAHRYTALEARYPGVRARDAYGMTEYVPATVMPLDAGALSGSGSCGLLAPHTEARIVDDAGQDVAPGAAGELIVRGRGMMSGYRENPEATAEAIRDGWLHTGDIFRQDENGYFYLVGRKKDMVRRNAENIACIEVEAVLRLHPEVAEAAVVAVPDPVVGEEVKAYVLTRRPDVDPESILAVCREHLARFKVPRYLAFVEQLPMTESARVEKKRLVEGVTDLTLNAYDAVLGTWRHPNPPRPTCLDDFPRLVGQVYTGPWLRLEEQRLQQFWTGTYLDRTYGAAMGPEYPAGLVEGFYQLGILDYLSADIIGRWHGFNYGFNRVRFLTPLLDHQRLRMILTISEVTPRDDGYLVCYDAQLETEGGTRPTMVAQWLVLLQDVVHSAQLSTH